MPKSFFSRIETRSIDIDSLLCVGLDPRPQDLEGLPGEDDIERLEVFCQRIIKATAPYAVAFKPNIAFFEAYGPQGVQALQRVIQGVPSGIPVILDAKRGDIASTARAYAQAVFAALGADALTVNPYLGHDAVLPFLLDPAKGVFLLCKTSNAGAGDLQNLKVLEVESPPGQESSTLYEVVARLANQWNVSGNLGLVVGATYPEELSRVRALAPEMWILSPGVGAQGGDLQAALQAGLRPDGMGMLVNVSRGISQADDRAVAAQNYRDQINDIRGNRDSHQPAQVAEKQEKLLYGVADGLLDAGCVKFGRFTLKSGIESPIYIDLRLLASYPELLAEVAAVYLPLLRRLSFKRLAALPYAALPVATAISLQSGWPMIYPRKEMKAYGTRAEIEGQFQPGDQAVIIDDLATTGGSKFEAIEKMTTAGLVVSDVVVLIDRQSGAGEAMTQAGYRLHAVFTLTQLLDYWERSGRVPQEQIIATRNFIERQEQAGS